MNRKTLIDVIPNPSNAIITALNTFDIPWKNNNYYVPDDMDYILNHSATRIISRMVNILLDNNGVLTENALAILANVIFKMYNRKWQKLYDTFNFEYNPINNYDMIEQMDETTTRDYTNQSTRTDNLSHSNNVTVDGTNQNIGEIKTDLQGFNSTTYNPTDKENSTIDETQHTVTITSEQNTGTQGVSHSGDDDGTRNYTLTRSGNIGVTTSQQMIDSERKLWEYNFVAMVYHDIDAVLTIQYYGGDCQ